MHNVLIHLDDDLANRRWKNLLLLESIQQISGFTKKLKENDCL